MEILNRLELFYRFTYPCWFYLGDDMNTAPRFYTNSITVSQSLGLEVNSRALSFVCIHFIKQFVNIL